MRFLRIKETTAKSGHRPSSIYELIPQDNFPRPVKLSDRCSAWIDEEIQSWQEWCIARRDGKCPKNMTWREWHEVRTAERNSVTA
ncbi:MAG: AlpA family phage regulatory protein [Rhodomicrobium sp.]